MTSGKGSNSYLSGSRKRNQRAKLIALFGERCWVVGCEGWPIGMDHIIPVSKGGPNGVGNKQLLCFYHGEGKDNNSQEWFKEWLAQRNQTLLEI
jgi:HNH endonuclease